MQTNNQSQGERVARDDVLDGRFPLTSWTLLVRAGEATNSALPAREEFARRYRSPILNYFAALTRDRQEAEELTQGFFEKLAGNQAMFATADPSRGRFRHYLKRALKNHWMSELRYYGRQKRHAEEEFRPDSWDGDGWARLALVAEGTPEAAFHRAWVSSLVEQTLVQVRSICEQKKQTVHFQLFAGMYFSTSPETPSWAELGGVFGLDEKTARSRAETVTRHVKRVLRKQLVEETGSAGAADEEIAALRALL